MKLRYIVETKFTPAFTVTKTGLNKDGVASLISNRKKWNERAGYMKYSGFKIYDDNDNELTPATR